MSLASDVGVLLINLGTPDAPTPAATRRYLAEFLSDPRVIDLPAPLRWLLLHGVILRTRPRRSAEAYAQIWREDGSPLLVHSLALARGVERELAGAAPVALAMRYGAPSIEDGLDALRARGARRFVLIPLFPQHAEATTGSALAAARERLGPDERAVAVEPFFAEPEFAQAWRECAGERLRAFAPDHVLLSYHGLPERQVLRADATGARCLATPDCCTASDAGARAGCYRAQCFATTTHLARALDLSPDRHSTSFQSRLGRARWIEPHTDAELPALAARGVRRLAVLCPAFVSDCLETLEEIGIRAAAQWRAL
ncbi:MAG: ferrochelatase, partial [Myxococcales bacterium]|nr:ferrochelatase [Myxococcales bacterium]